MARHIIEGVEFGTLARARVAAAVERAQGVVEYGLLMATIAIVVLLGVSAFGNQIEPWFQNLAARITTVGT
jgi:Flp pilus assembly pilin Flp